MSRGIKGRGAPCGRPQYPKGGHTAKQCRSAGKACPYLLAAFSGFLLALAFPRWNLWPLAWVALIPLFHTLEKSRSRKEAFLFGFTAGFVFFFLSISWLRHVTAFGLFFVAAVLATYWGVFGVVYCVWKMVTVTKKGDSHHFHILLLPALWVALEFIRSEIPVWGFGWNLLGYSQAPNLWIAQLASLGGVYLVSFLVLMGNTVIYSLIRNVVRAGFKPALTLRTTLLFFLLVAAASTFGWNRMVNSANEPRFRITTLQGNIPQLLKWEPAYQEEILKIYLNLTELASYDSPQLILWPEAAYPGFFNLEPAAEKVKERVRKIQVPLVVGSPHQEDAKRYYNSAYYLDGSGEIVQRYDKIRLVPFGEYVPWKPVLGFLEPYAYALGVSDFSAGRELTVFRTGEHGPKFSVLICFEDTFPDLARKLVDRGADFLAVMTNDAWFGRSSAPYQHLQASIFRAIENGASVVRAANTGVSGFISPEGKVVERVHNQQGKDTFVMGGMTYPVVWAKQETLYRKGGWMFPYGCLLVSVLTGLVTARRKEVL